MGIKNKLEQILEGSMSLHFYTDSMRHTVHLHLFNVIRL